MNLHETRYTLRQVAEIHGESTVTLQSWADKGWARISPAPGPGQTRELSLDDVYRLSIAIAFAGAGVAPKIANAVAHIASLKPHEAFEWRELTDPYHLFVQLGSVWLDHTPLVVPASVSSDSVKFLRLQEMAKDRGQFLSDVVAGVASGFGLYVNVTELLYYVDDALKTKLFGRSGWTRYVAPEESAANSDKS